jgi:NAD(P)-dependent dehydrogenase (short-subunit alcohol dehydrogenase family)
MHDFFDATILVTGAASGIGAATARRLSGAGAARLILVDLDAGKLADVASPLDCETSLVVGDVADEALWQSADLEGLTHAVANAGIGEGRPILESTLADWRRVMAVNLDGAFLTLKAAMAAMRGRGGAIVLTASAAGVKAEPGIAAYAASKAAVIQLARVAAKEGAPHNIRVNSIAPGGVETPIWGGIPMFDNLVRDLGSEEAAFRELGKVATPLGRFGKAEEIAGQIAFLLSADAAFVTGACLVSDGGYSL